MMVKFPQIYSSYESHLWDSFFYAVLHWGPVDGTIASKRRDLVIGVFGSISHCSFRLSILLAHTYNVGIQLTSPPTSATRQTGLETRPLKPQVCNFFSFSFISTIYLPQQSQHHDKRGLKLEAQGVSSLRYGFFLSFFFSTNYLFTVNSTTTTRQRRPEWRSDRRRQNGYDNFTL